LNRLNCNCAAGKRREVGGKEEKGRGRGINMKDIFANESI